MRLRLLSLLLAGMLTLGAGCGPVPNGGAVGMGGASPVEPGPVDADAPEDFTTTESGPNSSWICRAPKKFAPDEIPTPIPSSTASF